MYRVLEFFTDLQDNGYEYQPGDIFPRAGLTVSEGRYKELSGTENKRRMRLIELQEETPEKADAPKKRGRRKDAD